MLQKELENLLIEKCSLVFHSYFDRDMKTLIDLLDKDFVWIGSYDFQYTKGIDEFIKITKDEQNEDEADVYDEAYQILTKTENTYVVYGRFSASALKDNNTFLYTKQRATYVWRYINNEFKLLHLNATMARDVPLEQDLPSNNLKSKWYDYMLYADSKLFNSNNRILLKDIKGALHYLLPEEIIYINIDHRTASIHTASQEVFDINKQLIELMELLPTMLQCHKSWLVNPRYITKIERYKVSLLNNEELPIGKSRYDELKMKLQKISD